MTQQQSEDSNISIARGGDEESIILSITPTGLSIKDFSTSSGIISLAKHIVRVENKWATASRFYLGDIMVAAQAQYGDSLYEDVATATGKTIQELRNLKYVSDNCKVQFRNPTLSWSHHREVAPLTDKEQCMFLDKAEEHGLSAQSLKQAIASYKSAMDVSVIVTPDGGGEVEVSKQDNDAVHNILMSDILTFISMCKAEALDEILAAVNERIAGIGNSGDLTEI